MSATMCAAGARLSSVTTIESAALANYVRKMVRYCKDPDQTTVARFKETIRVAKEALKEHVVGCDRCAAAV